MAWWLLAAMACGISHAQTLNLPPRATNAPNGSQFSNIITPMSQTTRENWILGQIALGNVPGWMRTLVPITINKTINGTAHTLTYYVTPDYLAVGSDQDYFLEPMTPILAQRIANLLNCTLPTRLMVNYNWTNAALKLTPSTIYYTNPITTVPIFIEQDAAVMAQRNAVTNTHPLGALVSGDKKDVIISTLIYNNLTSGVPKPVVIYGWMYTTGIPIQGEVNVHAEAYADYSHGIRMVQLAVTLDGAANTVTNILADAVLWPLLSDEGVISKPYYTVDNFLPPLLITPPYSQTVKPGANVNFNTSVIGDVPFTYQWSFNGALIVGATTSLLSITNAQGTNAGTYTVVISNAYGSTTNQPAVLNVITSVFPLLFSDTLSADTSANWNFFWASAGGVPDYTVNWAYDFGAIPATFNGVTRLIPPAPNTTDGSTKGVKFTVNNSIGTNAAVNLYPQGKSFSNNFALKFDFWINYPGGIGGLTSTGSTEFVICGIDHLGTEINWAATSAPSSDGTWFAVDGEGGSSRDYRAYVGNSGTIQTDLIGSPSGLVSATHTSLTYQTLFPASRFETAGAPGKNWVAGEINQTNGVLTWKLDGTIVAQRANTSAFTSGNIMLGYMDIFPSIANPLADGFVLFANVRVEDWSLPPLQAPAVTVTPSSQTLLSGTNVTFTGNATGATPFTYQWTFNGANISGATNSSYFLAAVQTTNSGNYAVVVSNIVGSVISLPAPLTVTVRPFQFTPLTYFTNGNFQLAFNGAVGSHYTIETSSNLVTWQPLITLLDNANPVTCLDTNSTHFNNRFYRIVTAP